jgi:Zn-dependent protease
VTTNRTPDHAPGPGPAGTGPGQANRDGRVTGSTVRVTAGGYLLAVLAAVVSGLSLEAAAPGRPAAAYVAAGIVVAALLLGGVIIHEAGHVIAARRRGASTGGITVGFFGPTRHGAAELPGPGAQWRVAIAGPAASLALAALAGGGAAGLAALGVDRLPMLILGYAAIANGALGVLSLLPGTGPDGGRIVRALTWARTGNPAKADLVAARAGQFTGLALLAGGITVVVVGYPAGLWLALLGILAFATSRAQASRYRTALAVAGLRVSDVLPPQPDAPATRPAWQTVEELAADLGRSSWPSGTAVFPLHDFGGRPAGLLTMGQLVAVPAGRQDDVRLREVATPIAYLVTTTADEPLSRLLARLAAWPRIPVALHTAGYALVLTEDGQLAGVLTPADLTRAVQFGALQRGQRHQDQRHQDQRRPDQRRPDQRRPDAATAPDR